MGIVSSWLSQSNNMKFLLVLAVAAYVKAEADPALVYSTAGVYPYAALPYAAYPYVHHAVPLLKAGCTNDQGVVVPCAHGGLVAPVVAAAAAAPAEEAAEAVESVEKREAEPAAEATADAEADPWLYYSGLYGHHAYAPFAYSYAPFAYRHAYSYYGLPYAHYYGKRSADAEPAAEATADADANPEADPWLYYSGLYGHHAYAPFAYSYAPYTYSHAYSYYGLPHAYYYGK